MSRSAFIASLTLHTGLLLLVGWGSSNSARIGPGPAGTDASFFADATGGLLVATLPASSEPVPEPQLSEPEFIQSTPAVVYTTPLVSTIAAVPVQLPVITGIPHQISATKPKVSLARKGKANQRAFARADGPGDGQGGSGVKGDGAGLHGAGYVPPQFRLRYKPPYPDEARAQRLEGTVLLLVSIDASGRVTSTNVLHSCGHPVLDRAALAAVRAWRFDPARQDGVAIFARVEVPVRFRFEERPAARS